MAIEIKTTNGYVYAEEKKDKSGLILLISHNDGWKSIEENLDSSQAIELANWIIKNVK